MDFFDPSLLPPVKVVRRTETFSHEKYGDKKLKLTFEAQAGDASKMFVFELAEELVEEYTKGGKLVIDGSSNEIPVSETIARHIALLLSTDKSVWEKTVMVDGVQQVVPIPRFDFAKWVILLDRSPEIFWDVVRFANGVYDEACGKAKVDPDSPQVDLGNDLRASGGCFSLPPSTTQDDTLTS